jgi:hypothetical protein
MAELWPREALAPDGVLAEAPTASRSDRERRRVEPEAPTVRGFALVAEVAEVAENLSTARWGPAGFRCDRDLLRRAEVVAALGEIIARPDGGYMDTTTDPCQPLALLCTLIRASDRVVDLRVDLAAGSPVAEGA